MFFYEYLLPGGATGTIRASDDEDAWNEIKAQMGQYPIKHRVLAVADSGVAA